jgi:protease-4
MQLVNQAIENKERGIFSRFFGGLWSAITWVRTALANIIFLLIILLLFVAFSSRTTFPIPDNFALRVAPTGMLVDQRTYIDPASMLLGGTNPKESETVVSEVVDAINFAAKDDRINTIVLELDFMLGGGISKMQEIGQALDVFKANGKKIIAIGDNYTQDQYFLASYADEIYLNDMGAVLLTGYGSYRNYFKGALDKLEINFHVFRSGKFKDAVEPLLREDMSADSKEHNSQWLNQLWEQYTQQVEHGRQLPAGTLTEFVNNMDSKLMETGGDSARLAVEAGLVNGLRSYQDAQQYLIEMVGEGDSSNIYNGVDANHYLAEVKRAQLPKANKIGLLVASGTVLDGDHPDGTIGSHTLAEMLRLVREEKSIKALVLRVDSGGGSAFASEVIRTELAATRAAGIPVFISMGSLAASGGYWIAAGGDQIWATPTTLTGSIGVFGAFPTFENTLANLGLTTDGVGTTELAGAMRPDRELSPKANAIIQLNVNHIYQRFINLVATARAADVDAIDEIAQGRVWSGVKAQELGLVDHIGTLNDVIAATAAHVGVTDYSIQMITRPLSPGEAFMRELFGAHAEALTPRSFLSKFAITDIQQGILPLLKPLAALGKMNDPQSVYAACIACVAP